MADIITKISEPQEKGSVQIVDSPEQLVFYANASEVSFTPEEAMLHFGVRVPKNPTEAKGLVRIYLSMPHIKRLAQILPILIQNYENLTNSKIDADPGATMLQNQNKIQNSSNIKTDE